MIETEKDGVADSCTELNGEGIEKSEPCREQSDGTPDISPSENVRGENETAESGEKGENGDGKGADEVGAIDGLNVDETAAADATCDEQSLKNAAIAAKDESKKKMRKKILTYVLFIAVNALVILFLIFNENRSGERVNFSVVWGLLKLHPWYTLCAFSMFFVIIIADIIVFWSLMTKLHVERRSFISCVNVSFLGRYYDRVTPWSMGGEPFQIFYLNKRGLSTADSAAVTMSRHIIRFFTVAIAVIIILVASQISTNVWVMAAAIASVLAGLIVPVFMLLCAWKPKLGLRIGGGILKFLCKLKFIKDYDKAYAKMEDSVNNFLNGIKVLSANKILILIIGLCALVEMFAYNSVPYFVMKALDVGASVGYWHTLVLCLFVTYASGFAPTPGGAGLAELSFYAIFAAYIGEGLLFWAVLIWRIAVFYIPVFIGFVMQMVSSLSSIARTKRAYSIKK